MAWVCSRAQRGSAEDMGAAGPTRPPAPRPHLAQLPEARAPADAQHLVVVQPILLRSHAACASTRVPLLPPEFRKYPGKSEAS